MAIRATGSLSRAWARLRSSSRVARTPAAWAALLLLLLVAVAHALVDAARWRRSRAQERAGEGFFAGELLPVVDMDAARSPKSVDYANAALKFFYSSGRTATNPALVSKDILYFNPTRNDVVCQLGSASLMANCRRSLDTIDYVTCEDEFIALPETDCMSVSVARDPFADADCGVRVLDRSYWFHKRCTALRVIYRDSSTSQGALYLSPDGPSTALTVLSRPMFVTLSGGQLRAVSYTRVDGVQNQVSDYDSDRAGETLLPLVAVDQSKFSVDLLGLSDREVVRSRQAAQSQAINASQPLARVGGFPLPGSDAYSVPIDVSTTLYYLSPNLMAAMPPQTPVPAPSGATPSLNSVTFYFAGPSRTAERSLLTDPALNIKTAGGALVATPAGSGGTAAPSCSIPLPEGVTLATVTYTMDLVIMFAASDRRVVLRHFPVSTVLSISGAMRAKSVVPDALVGMVDAACIPNFAHLAKNVCFFKSPRGPA
jgi:hypothetical protein